MSSRSTGSPSQLQQQACTASGAVSDSSGGETSEHAYQPVVSLMAQLDPRGILLWLLAVSRSHLLNNIAGAHHNEKK